MKGKKILAPFTCDQYTNVYLLTFTVRDQICESLTSNETADLRMAYKVYYFCLITSRDTPTRAMTYVAVSETHLPRDMGSPGVRFVSELCYLVHVSHYGETTKYTPEGKKKRFQNGYRRSLKVVRSGLHSDTPEKS